MADAPVTVPVKLVQDGNIGIHTGANPVSIEITHVKELTNTVLTSVNETINHDVDRIVHHDILPHLHCIEVSLILGAVFLALILVVMTISLVISAIALHKIAKQGEVELELEELS